MELDVSRETISLLEKFQSLVIEWQPKLNLISPKDLPNLWQRHIIDSIQLATHIASDCPASTPNCLDMGSGAGFPGIILSLLGYKLTLVEADAKKCVFLREAKRILGIDCQIIHSRLEDVQSNKYDVVTSRALANLTKLFEYSEKFVSRETILVLPKGKSWSEEIKDARANWEFEFKAKPSITSDDAKILVINHLVRGT